MLSFRFHIVSLIAVFLALAIGIAVGSTFIDRAIVNSLQDRVDNVSANLDARRAENQELGDRIDGLTTYVEETAPWLVEDRLNGRSIVVIAERGVADDPVEAQVELLRLAGADVAGIVWLEEELALLEEQDRDALAEVVSLDEGESDDLHAQLWAELAAEPANGAATLAALVDADLADLDPVGGDAVDPADLRITTGSVLLVTGQASAMGAGDATAVAAAALVEGGANVLVGEVYVEPSGDAEDAPARGDALAPLLDDPELARAVATDDALDLLRGRTAAVLALEELGVGRVSHVGLGEGADAAVPPFTES